MFPVKYELGFYIPEDDIRQIRKTFTYRINFLHQFSGVLANVLIFLNRIVVSPGLT
jgi:hypothetical protein